MLPPSPQRRIHTTPSLLTGITAGVAAGIATAHCHVLSTGALLPATWLAAALFLSVACCLFRRNTVPIALSALLTGALLDTLHWHSFIEERDVAIATTATMYEAVVTSEPQHRTRSSAMRATILGSHGTQPLTHPFEIHLTTHRDTTIYRGSHLLFSGELQPLHPTLRPCFHFDTWLVHQGIVCRSFAHRHTLLPRPHFTPPLRDRLLSQLRSSSLTTSTEAVVEAMLLGSKTRLDSYTRHTYSDAGGSHLLALSGLHLGILTGAILLLFGPSLHLRWLRLLAVLPTVWGYVWLTGAPPSLIRAATMLSVWMTADVVLRRHVSSSDALTFTTLGLLVIRPFWLFDTGFQLSVTAVFGLTSITTVRQGYNLHWQPANRMTRYFFNLIVVSAVATIFTAPIVAVTFHRLPLLGWLMSAAYIPLTTLAVLASLLLLALLLLGLPTHWVTVAIDSLMQSQLTLMQHTGIVASDLYPSWLTVAVAYVLLLCFIFHRRVLMYFAAATLAITLAADRLIPVTPAVYFDGGTATVVQSRRTIHRLPMPCDTTFCRHGLYAYGPVTILRADGTQWRHTRRATPYPVDYLWVCRGFNGHIPELLRSVAPRHIVLDNNLSPYYRTRFLHECDSLALPIFTTPLHSLTTPLPSHTFLACDTILCAGRAVKVCRPRR